jgi:hypothetical protein
MGAPMLLAALCGPAGLVVGLVYMIVTKGGGRPGAFIVTWLLLCGVVLVRVSVMATRRYFWLRFWISVAMWLVLGVGGFALGLLWMWLESFGRGLEH